jgi:hypothetical protein
MFLDARPNPVSGLQEPAFPRLLSSRNRRCMESSVYAPAIIRMSSRNEDCGAKRQLPNKPAANGWPSLLHSVRISAADRTGTDSRLDDGEGGRHRQQRVVSSCDSAVRHPPKPGWIPCRAQQREGNPPVDRGRAAQPAQFRTTSVAIDHSPPTVTVSSGAEHTVRPGRSDFQLRLLNTPQRHIEIIGTRFLEEREALPVSRNP